MDEKMNGLENEIEVYTLQDEEGNEHEFELIATCEKNNTTYYAMIPYAPDAKEDEVCEYVILKAVIVDGKEDLITIDDDDEFDDIADCFDDMLASEIDYDAEPPKN